MKRFYNLFYIFDKPSIEEIAAYQHKIPRDIMVAHVIDKDTGKYVARISEVDGKVVKGAILTEAKNANELVEMVNDAVFTYLDIPERIRPSLPRMLPKDIDFADRLAMKGKLMFAK